MPYVARGADGRIVAIAAEATAGIPEPIAADEPELLEFLGGISEEVAGDFARSDLAFIRVVEDLIDTLIHKNLLRFTDLPEAARQKLQERRSLRHSMGALNLLGDAGGVDEPEIKL